MQHANSQRDIPIFSWEKEKKRTTKQQMGRVTAWKLFFCGIIQPQISQHLVRAEWIRVQIPAWAPRKYDYGPQLHFRSIIKVENSVGFTLFPFFPPFIMLTYAQLHLSKSSWTQYIISTEKATITTRPNGHMYAYSSSEPSRRVHMVTYATVLRSFCIVLLNSSTPSNHLAQSSCTTKKACLFRQFDTVRRLRTTCECAKLTPILIFHYLIEPCKK